MLREQFPSATVEEFKVFIFEEDFETLETKRAEQLLRSAYVAIVDWIGLESRFTEACQTIQLQMVARVWDNPKLLTQSTVGPESAGYALGQYGLYFTREEERKLNGLIKKSGLRTLTTYRNDQAGWLR